MYDLSLDRRKQERRRQPMVATDTAASSRKNHRRCERRSDHRPLDEFPFLPICINY